MKKLPKNFVKPPIKVWVCIRCGIMDRNRTKIPPTCQQHTIHINQDFIGKISCNAITGTIYVTAFKPSADTFLDNALKKLQRTNAFKRKIYKTEGGKEVKHSGRQSG